MALGTQVLGSLAAVLIGTVSGTVTTPVGGLVSWSYVDDVPSTTRNYYQQASSIAVGKDARTITLTCDYETGDAGQLILFGARTSKNTIYCKILVDGTNGETLPVKVTNSEIAGPDVNSYSTATFTLAQQTDPTVVGTGYGT
jgi:hypothetical protein